MATFRHMLVLGALLGATPAVTHAALAQPLDPAGPRAARSLTATGQTKPPTPAAVPSSASAPLPKPATEAAMVKAQKEAEARSKAWDGKMRRTMGSICNGC